MAGEVQVDDLEQLKQINRWIIDYVCQRMWIEFRNSKDISSDSKDYIQGILAQPVDVDRCRDKFYILLILCRLSDGEQYEIQYSFDSEITVLEDMLGAFKKLLSLQTADLKREGMELIPSIKAEAVYVCCRDNDLQMANDVFDRVWTASEQNDRMCLKVKGILKSEKQRQKVLDNWPYSKFLDLVIEFLTKIVKKFEMPLLTKVAQSIESSEHGNTSNNAQSSRVIKLDVLRKAAPNGIDVTSPSDIPVTEETQVRVEALRQENIKDLFGVEAHQNKRDRPKQSHSTERAEFRVPEPPSRSPDRPSPSGFRYRKNLNRSNRHEPTTSSPDPKDADNRSMISDVSSVNRARRKWTEEEKHDFFLAVERFGVGRWAEIRNYLETTRTSVDLKDKWRNMLKSGDVDRLKSKRQKTS